MKKHAFTVPLQAPVETLFIKCVYEKAQYLCSVEPIQIARAKGSFFNKQEIDKRFF